MKINIVKKYENVFILNKALFLLNQFHIMDCKKEIYLPILWITNDKSNIFKNGSIKNKDTY